MALKAQQKERTKSYKLQIVHNKRFNDYCIFKSSLVHQFSFPLKENVGAHMNNTTNKITVHVET